MHPTSTLIVVAIIGQISYAATTAEGFLQTLKHFNDNEYEHTDSDLEY